MHANNEIGTIEPVAEIGKIAREAGVNFHIELSIDRIDRRLVVEIASGEALWGVGQALARRSAVFVDTVDGKATTTASETKQALKVHFQLFEVVFVVG